MELKSGVRELYVTQEVIARLYQDKVVPLVDGKADFDQRYSFNYQNEYLIFKDQDNVESEPTLARVKGDSIVLLDNRVKPIYGVKPRNIKQRLVFDALSDDSLQVVVLTGKAGSGKTYCGLSHLINKLEENKYQRAILSKPMSQVGGHRELGILPGSKEEKFSPYLDNFMDNIAHLVGNKQSVEHFLECYELEFKPLQLIRGASWMNAFVLIDEIQCLNYHEMVTLGTRVGEGCKLLLMGDLSQRDEKINIDKTGMYKLITSELFQKSPLTAHIHLDICERGPVAALFCDIFEV